MPGVPRLNRFLSLDRSDEQGHDQNGIDGQISAQTTAPHLSPPPPPLTPQPPLFSTFPTLPTFQEGTFSRQYQYPFGAYDHYQQDHRQQDHRQQDHHHDQQYQQYDQYDGHEWKYDTPNWRYAM